MILRILLAAGLAAAAGGCALAPATPATLSVRVVAFNDFHGHLEPPSFGVLVPDPAAAEGRRRVRAGGIAHLATAISELKAGREHAIVVGAGDLVSGSPLISSLFKDEPAVRALGEAGLEISAVGNHEFDRGRDELLRLQNGGCHPKEGCFDGPWTGATFRWLGANVIDTATGKPFLPPYEIREFGGVPVAFVGTVLRSTPSIVMKSGIEGLAFLDEAEAANALVPELRAKGVEAMVLLIHEGGQSKGALFDPACPGFDGAIVPIVKRLDPAFDLVVSGHTHQAYLCRVNGRWVTQAGQYGQILTYIDLELDRATRDVVRAEPGHRIVDTAAFPARPALAAYVAGFAERARQKAARPVGRAQGEFTPVANAAGESSLGSLVADAQLHATRAAGAQVAFMNPGGLRAPLSAKGGGDTLTYGDLHAVQPFGNTLVTMTLTGEQVLRALENQWRSRPGDRTRFLQVSDGFSYRWDDTRPIGQRIVPGSVRIAGAPLEPGARYRVTVNSFMADGGDGFTVFAEGTERTGGPLDLDAFEQFLEGKSLVAGPPPGRLARVSPP